MPSRRKSTQLLSEVAQVVCEMMRATGLDRPTVELELKSAVEIAFASKDLDARRIANPLSEMASLISRWHVSEKYVDASGKPKSLSWHGGRGPLLRLAQEIVGRDRAQGLIENVISRKLIKKTDDGRWRPTSQVVKPKGLDRPQILRTAMMLRRFLRTISYNSKRRYRGDDLLFEVMTRVPRLPTRHLPAFKKFARTQGMTYVRSVDDWLESRGLPKSEGKSRNLREAGVIVFAYEEPTADP
jgi:hypothetical protein